MDFGSHGLKGRKGCIIIATVLFLAGVAAVGVVTVQMNTMFFLREGEIIHESRSPDGEWQVRIHYVAQGTSHIWAEVVEERSDRTRRFYLEAPQSHADVHWTGSTVISINGHRLDVRSDVWDYRRELDS